MCGNTWIDVFILHLRRSTYSALFDFLIFSTMLTFYDSVNTGINKSVHMKELCTVMWHHYKSLSTVT